MPLQAKYCGPYVVEKRIGEVDYKLLAHDKRKTKRIVRRNLLKRFHARDPVLIAIVATRLSVDPVDQLAKVDLSHLKRDQRLQLMTLLERYRWIFDSDPGFTTVVQHKIAIVPNAKPCRQTPYCLSPDKTRWINSQLHFIS